MKIEYVIKDNKQLMREELIRMLSKMNEAIKNQMKIIDILDNNLKLADPKRQLKLGYSIVRIKDKVLKSKTQIKVDDELEIFLNDGTINTKINKIN